MSPFVEMLLKLFCNYVENSSSVEELQHLLKELNKAKTALEALDEFLKQPPERSQKKGYLCQYGAEYRPQTFRVFSPEEQSKLSIECLGLLHELEKIGILTPKDRDLALLHVSLHEGSSLELDEFKRALQTLFGEKFSALENWWLQAWPFTESLIAKGH